MPLQLHVSKDYQEMMQTYMSLKINRLKKDVQFIKQKLDSANGLLMPSDSARKHFCNYERHHACIMGRIFLRWWRDQVKTNDPKDIVT
jgi:hypothetical protein